MGKIFIDDKIWEQEWFQQLEMKKKLLYIYIFTRSDHAGFLKINIPLVNFLLNLPEKEHFTKDDLFETFKKDKIIPLKTNRLWIPSKIIFQQGLDRPPHQLGESVIHKSITSLIVKHGVQDIWQSLLSKKYGDSQEMLKGYSNSNSIGKGNGKSKRARGIQDVKVEEFELEYPNVDIKHEYKKWRNWLKANGRTYIDYVAAFTNWVSTDYVKKKEDTKSKVYTFSCRDCDEVQTAETRDFWYLCKCNKKLKILT